jgi:hypothetical protein
MRIAGRTLHTRIPSTGGEDAPVELDPNAAPLLKRVLASRLGILGHSRATFETWLGEDGERVTVHIGIARVGTLDEEASALLRPLIENARVRSRKVIALATLTAADGPGPAYLLKVRVPPA